MLISVLYVHKYDNVDIVRLINNVDDNLNFNELKLFLLYRDYFFFILLNLHEQFYLEQERCSIISKD